MTEESGDKTRESKAPFGAETATILVVDDEELNRDLMDKFLSRRGFTVLTSESGRDALQIIETHPVDLVVLDVLMPDLDGLLVLERIRADHSISELPVVMATGLDSTEDIIQALELGANDYVTKPIDFRLTEARLKTALALKRASDQVTQLNRQLEDAHERILRLVDSSSSALADLATWATAIAEDVAEAIGVEEVGVWALENQRLSVLSKQTVRSPRLVDLAMILKGKDLQRQSDTVVPVIGYTQELLGALVVPGHESDWAHKAKRLLTAFSRQLGGALELRQAREKLAVQPAEDRECLEYRPDGQAVLVCRLCGLCYGEDAEGCADCGPGAFLHSPWPIPYRLSERYRLSKVLGKGGMGVVFAAADDRLDREVAIKVINPEYLDNKTVRARFRQEAQAIASIRDPGVVEVHDFGELSNGAFFIVMERLHGLDLEYLVQNCGPGQPEEVAAFLRQGATALDAAHAAKVIHRDIKPGNFFLIPTASGFHVKVLDFGLARRLTVESDLTRAGRIVGTPMYMAPEQAMGKPVDPRTDIYSFAAVAFRTLTGRHISQRRSYAKILADVVRNPAPAISSFLPKVPRRVDRAFAKALSKEPKRRPPTAETWVAGFVDQLEAMPSNVEGWRTTAGLLGVDAPEPGR